MKVWVKLITMVALGGWLGVAANPLPTAIPSSAVGLDEEALAAMTRHFSDYVTDGRLHGLTTLVSRKGKIVHFEVYGKSLALEGELKKDAIFRIHSMTKPVTGVALMMLYEQGKFSLDDPISEYLPEFRAPKVFKAHAEDGSVVTSPADREITIKDLMQHTAGLAYGVFGDTPVDKLYQQNGVLEPGLSADEWMVRLASQPLLYQPGEAWIYSFAVDVQGRLVEVLSGAALDVFFKEQIFDPLGMNDTGFYISEQQAERLVALHAVSDDGLVVAEDPYFPDFTQKPRSFSGGGGLVSTTMDYWRFAQMLLNGGELEGRRILKADTVALMTTDQLPASLNGIANGSRGLGFGLGFAVVKDVAKQGGHGRVGEFFWGGMANTLFWVDPTEEIIAILMTNVFPNGVYPLGQEMHKFVYEALE